MSRLHQWQELSLRHEAVKLHLAGETELAREPLDLAAEQVLTNDIQVEGLRTLRELGKSPEQRRLVLHSIETRHVNQASGLTRRAPRRHSGGPGLHAIDSERHSPCGDSERGEELELRCARRRQRARRRIHHPLLQPAPPAQSSAEADVRKTHGLPASDVHDARNAEQTRGRYRDQTAGPGEERLHESKRRLAMLPDDRPQGAHSRGAAPDIVDSRSEQAPSGGVRLLTQRKHVHLVMYRQALDQREECRYDTVFPAPIDAPGDDQRELHVW